MAHDQALLQDAQLKISRCYKTLAARTARSRNASNTTYQAALGSNSTKAASYPIEATIDTANLNIAYCHIVAPAGGRIGLRQVDQGNYVTSSSANSANITWS